MIRELDIAIIGMSCRFPGASSVAAFWENLRNGVEAVATFSDAELLAAGVDPAWLQAPNYVKAGTVIADADCFDAQFFGFTPREATLLDPQHRLFLECAQTAIEDAGYNPQAYPGAIGVYAGTGASTHLRNNRMSNAPATDFSAAFQSGIANDKDFLATQVSYRLDLKGPSVTVQTACSTSLVAVHMACQSLLNGECHIALAGGVSLNFPQQQGYLYQAGMILSPDGHCRAFDANAQGTVVGGGVGIVVLKRAEDALADGDTIHAIIKGTAINNDGAVKVSYTAPSVDGQARVIREAQSVAGVAAETITYIEAHGTGTSLGDPTEIAALTQAFQSQQRGFCAIGSVKTNIGHADTAAGIAGLIKTVLALKHRMIPPSLHFAAPNPQIDFAQSPFYVNNSLSAWQTSGDLPRRAGVSSFGIGGTNAHAILEEAPAYPPAESSHSPLVRPAQLLVLSAKTAAALETATANLAEHLTQQPDLALADVAYTLQVGRQRHPYRRVWVGQTREDAILALNRPEQLKSGFHTANHRPVAFLFPGQGTQYVHMARELYTLEPIFRAQIDRCATHLTLQLGLDLRTLLYPPEPLTEQQAVAAAQTLQQTIYAQPALFMVEYALAKLWQAWGIEPQALIGHSLGEYVAACLAGVFSLDDALTLVAARGRLMQTLPSGAMLAVPRRAEEIVLPPELSVAAINEPSSCVVSGCVEAIAVLEQQLAEQGVVCLRLQTSHAFHSAMVEPILPAFREQFKTIPLHPPQIPYLSNLTGTWIQAAEATNPSYWVNHLRQTVQFAAGIGVLLKEPELLLLEVGPGRTLSAFAKQHPAKTDQIVLRSLRHPQELQADLEFLLTTLGELWLAGGTIDWAGVVQAEPRRRLPLPTYPFERQRYWVEPATRQAESAEQLVKKPAIADWFYVPSWERSLPPVSEQTQPEFARQGCWLLFIDECGLGAQLAKRLAQAGQTVIIVRPGVELSQVADNTYTLNPQSKEHYDGLMQRLLAQGQQPQTILHLWRVTAAPNDLDSSSITADLALGFYSLLFLTQALGSIAETLALIVITNHLHEVTGDEAVCPAKATLLGPVKVIPQEYPNLSCRSIDIQLSTAVDLTPSSRMIDQLMAELSCNAAASTGEQPTNSQPAIIAYRGKYRWVQKFQPLPLPENVQPTRIKEKGVYLITGGLGEIGLRLAADLASFQAKLILIGRSVFPDRQAWAEWIATHGEDNAVSQQICKVQKIETLGAEVLLIRADVANVAQMQNAMRQAEARFGSLDGVFHAAGITKTAFRFIEELSPADCHRQFQPKIDGLVVLDKVLQGKSPDFCLVFSSLSAVLGGLGFTAYAGANAFMDAFVAQSQRQNKATQWISVNWDGWLSPTRDKDNMTAQNLPTGLGNRFVELALAPQDGIEALRRILALFQASQVIVSTGALNARIEQWNSPQTASEATKLTKPVALLKRSGLQNKYVAPRSPIEQTIAASWEEILGIREIGIDEDFFELGGHSLLAIQLINHIRAALQTDLTLSALFKAPTIAGLAAAIGKQAPVPPLATIQPVARTSDLPLSFVQEETWLLSQSPTLGSLHQYNLVIPLRLIGQLDVEGLRQSFNALIARHEILRTSYRRTTDATWAVVQCIAPTATVDLPILDLTRLTEQARSAEIERLRAAETEQLLDLTQTPLLRLTLVRLAAEDHLLLYTGHHISGDNWSFSIMLHELETFYTAFMTEKPAALAPLPFQYADYAAWQRRFFTPDVLAERQQYWQRLLAKPLTRLNLPADRPYPLAQKPQTHAADTEAFALSSALSAQLKQLSQQQSASLSMLLLAAYAALLYRYSGCEDLLIASPTNKRQQPGTEHLIGHFAGLALLRIDLAAAPAFGDLLAHVKSVLLAALTDQDISLRQLLHVTGTEWLTQGRPQFQAIFNFFQTGLMAKNVWPGVTVTPVDVGRAHTVCEIALELWEESTSGADYTIHGAWIYRRDLFEAATIRQLSENFQRLLNAVLADPTCLISEVQLSYLRRLNRQ